MTMTANAVGVRTPHRAGSASNAPAIDISALGTSTLPSVGRWQLVQRTGRGSWSQVYCARPMDLPPERPASYAVKLVLPGRQNDPLASLLLAREAVVGRRVSSPHVVPVLEAQLERGPKFIVMPWLEAREISKSGSRPTGISICPW